MSEQEKSTEATAEIVHTEAQAIVEEKPKELPVATDIVVMAKDPEEMAIAQKSLTTWAEKKIAVLEMEEAEAQTNLDLAIKRKWSTTAFKKALGIAKGRVVYYKKVKAALEAGYVIIPDMPAQTIAIRTTKEKPRAEVKSSNWGTPRDLPSAESDSSEAGKGRYISPVVEYDTWTNTNKLSDGSSKTIHFARASNYIEGFDFPLALVKPQILDETNKALVLKIFDEIGILGAGSPRPGKKLPASSSTRPDPIVLGRIVRQEGMKRFSCAFLITWWLDTRTL